MAGYSTTVRNAKLDALTTAAGANATIKFYTATRPATGGTATTLLGTVTCGATLAPAASGGVLTANAITGANAVATGTCTWARLATSGATVVADFSVGTSGTEIVLVSTSFTSGQPVAVSSFTITDGNP
jgi:hypothetical protein